MKLGLSSYKERVEKCLTIIHNRVTEQNEKITNEKRCDL